jgi:hypothetical protein
MMGTDQSDGERGPSLAIKMEAGERLWKQPEKLNF